MGDVFRSRIRRWWGWLLFTGIWCLAGRNLTVHWSANPVYSYGWLVPLLGLYAAWGRWSTRPEPGPPRAGGGWLIAVAAFAFFPTWVFAQPNPDWSFMAWLLTAEIVAMTLGAVALVGGWEWAGHFVFPVCYIFAAVPCPHVIEMPMTVGLMRDVAAFTVELLNLCGVASVQHGNVIEVRSGLLGVDEACSGVRSLQAAFTGSLFLGELFRFSWARRIFLVFIGLGAALCTNVARTFFLSWNASRNGIASITKWHDPAGFFTLTVCLAVVWLVAFLLAGGAHTYPRQARVARTGRTLPMGLLAALTLWILAVLAAVEMWFYDGGSPPESLWSLLPPADAVPVEISEGAAQQLQCDRLGGSQWREPDGSNWLMFFLEWRPGPLRSRVLARVHRPEVCLSSVGLKLIEDRGSLSIESGGIKLPFRAYTFDQGGHPLFVYYGIWQNRSRRGQESGELSESEHMAGLQAVLWRERNLGQQVAEFAATGYASAGEADAGFRETLEKLVVRRLPPMIGN